MIPFLSHRGAVGMKLNHILNQSLTFKSKLKPTTNLTLKFNLLIICVSFQYFFFADNQQNHLLQQGKQ